MSDDITTRLPGESLADFGRRRMAAMGIGQHAPAASATPAQKKVWDDDLIPHFSPSERTASPERVEIDAIVKPLTIIDAYRKWCHKMNPDGKGRRESIMVSCPNPAHPDRNPSAWITLDKGDGGVGNCAVCGGFDKYDIAAWSYGFDVPGYRTSDFPEVVRRMAEDMGYRIMIQGKAEWAEKISEEIKLSAPKLEIPPPDFKDDAEVGDDATDDWTNVESIMPPASFAWADLPAVKPGTFLHDWMEITSESYEPEEFYLWLGLMLLGIAVGNDVQLKDNPDVRSNLLVCLVGATGTGKSIAIRTAEVLARNAFPWDGASGSGVKMIGSPGSGEALIDAFNHTVDDPTGGGAKLTIPVKGLYRENELSTFVKKASRTGSTIREVIMDMFDTSHAVSISSRAAGNVTARDHYLAIVSSTQPDALGGLLSHNDASSGFLNRWVFAYGHPKYRPARATYRPDTDPLVDTMRNIRAWAVRGRSVDWHDIAAGIAFDSFYDRRVRPLIVTEETDSPLVARLPLLAKKLVLLFAINSKRTTVLVEDVESAEKIWDSVLTAYTMVSRRVSMTIESDCMERIKAYMSARPDQEFTVRQITKQSGARRYAAQGAMIQKVIAVLVALGEIEEVPRPRDNKSGVAKYRYVKDPEAGASGRLIAFPGGVEA